MNQEILIRRLDSLVTSCNFLAGLIRGFDKVLNKENEAIARSDINELEAITQEKVFFGAKVDEGIQEIKKQMALIGGFLEKDRDSLKIESLVQILKNDFGLIISQGSRPALAIESLEGALESLSQARKDIFPKIEANAYMVKKLLQYHRETYAFWQSVAQESEAVYGKTGKAVAVAQKSILTVRT